ncbi:MAG: SpoIID/LytB domain-containing protein [Muribaculaceae bacterium]|nr:SpoIID/LytB domain-containing protein [Muribaculaceae bacterium]
MANYYIKVGIKTDGSPVLEHYTDYTLVKNMLIGDGFHWQRSLEVCLPGEVSLYKSSEQSEIIGSDATEADRNITLINRLPLETYLECVVGSEMNPSASIEFLKAHAVISRSWALGKVLGAHPCNDSGYKNTSDCLIGWDDTAGHHGFDVCSDDHCQRYQGLQPITPIALQAIRDTAGEVLTVADGSLVDARFSKCCGGRTEVFSTCWQSRSVSCLESFDDPWCDLSGLSADRRRKLLSSILKDYDLVTEGYGYRWQNEISKTTVRENLWRRFGRDVGEILRLESLHRGPSGRIDLLRIHGTRGTLDLGKELWIRRLLSSSHLYSSAVDIEDLGSAFRLTGRGWGHGVGLCQIGAANMAVHGYNYRNILSFYYPGAVITSI